MGNYSQGPLRCEEAVEFIRTETTDVVDTSPSLLSVNEFRLDSWLAELPPYLASVRSDLRW